MATPSPSPLISFPAAARETGLSEYSLHTAADMGYIETREYLPAQKRSTGQRKQIRIVRESLRKYLKAVQHGTK